MIRNLIELARELITAAHAARPAPVEVPATVRPCPASCPCAIDLEPGGAA